MKFAGEPVNVKERQLERACQPVIPHRLFQSCEYVTHCFTKGDTFAATPGPSPEMASAPAGWGDTLRENSRQHESYQRDLHGGWNRRACGLLFRNGAHCQFGLVSREGGQCERNLQQEQPAAHRIAHHVAVIARVYQADDAGGQGKTQGERGRPGNSISLRRLYESFKRLGVCMAVLRNSFAVRDPWAAARAKTAPQSVSVRDAPPSTGSGIHDS